jgi:hypothetical protein
MSKWLGVLIACFFVAQPVAADDRAKLLGVWRLVAYELEFQDTGERLPTFGKRPFGYLIITPEGRMMAYLEAENRTAPKTLEEQAAAFRTTLAYTGTYHIEGDKFVTQVDGSWNVAWVGTVQVRIFKFQGDDQIHVVSQWQRSATRDNRMARGFVVWERQKSSLDVPPNESGTSGAPGVSDFAFTNSISSPPLSSEARAVHDRVRVDSARKSPECEDEYRIKRLAVTAAPGSWGGQRPSLAPYFRVTEATSRVTARRRALMLTTLAPSSSDRCSRSDVTRSTRKVVGAAAGCQDPTASVWTWPALLRRVFPLDVLACPRCGGRLRVIAASRPPRPTGTPQPAARGVIHADPADPVAD